MSTVRIIGAVAGAAILAGCAQSVDRLNNTQAVGDAFTQALAAEYRDLANFEGYEMQDWPDATYFANKGLAAAAGETVLPADLANWHLPESSIPELQEARADLIAALDANARTSLPEQAAVAQAKFDCWVEQQEENHQPADIAACRDEFFLALGEIQVQPAPAAAAPRTYIVFFDWDQSTITPTGQNIIGSVGEDFAVATGDPLVSIAGHADTSGPADYNVGLSERRAGAVEEALLLEGIPANRISTNAFGETQLLVVTPDGVREPANRRAEIRFR